MRHKRASGAPGRRPRGVGLAIAFVAPGVILVATLMYYPMLRAVYDSMTATAFLNPHPRFVGLQNYVHMLHDSAFWQVVRNSVVWTLGVVLFQNVLGMAAALLLNQDLPAKAVTRVIVLLPWILPGIVGAIIWRFMYDPQLGLINAMLLELHVVQHPAQWLAKSSTAMVAVIAAAVWKGFPFSAVIYLAGLQGVQHDQLEAAEIDGASASQRFVHIVLPSMAGIVRLNLLLTTIFTFNYFDMIWVTTRGGPLGATQIFPTKIFDLGFGQFKFGEAAAYGVVSVIVLALIGVMYVRELRHEAA